MDIYIIKIGLFYPLTYSGQRSASAIVEEAARLAKTMIQDRMAGKGGKSGGEGSHSTSYNITL